MVGREEVKGEIAAIRSIDNGQKFIEQTRFLGKVHNAFSRPVHVGRGEQENQKADDVGCRKPDDVINKIALFGQGGINGAEDPENVGIEIDDHEKGL